MPNTMDWPACPHVLYSDWRALFKVLKPFSFPEMWMKTGHAHLYRLTTDAFLISFRQKTVLVLPSFVQVTTERRCPHTFYDLRSLNERLACKRDGWFHTSRTTRYRQWYNSSSNAFPNTPLTKSTEIIVHNHEFMWVQVSIHAGASLP